MSWGKISYELTMLANRLVPDNARACFEIVTAMADPATLCNHDYLAISYISGLDCAIALGWIMCQGLRVEAVIAAVRLSWDFSGKSIGPASCGRVSVRVVEA